MLSSDKLLTLLAPRLCSRHCPLSMATLPELILAGRALPAWPLRLAYELQMVLPVVRGDPVYIPLLTVATACSQPPSHTCQRLTVLSLVSIDEGLPVSCAAQCCGF